MRYYYELKEQSITNDEKVFLSMVEHLVIIRFSVILNRDEFLKKINSLLCNERLEYRFKLFETFCLPSLLQQSLIDYKIIIIIDENLPINWKTRLTDLTKDYNFITLHSWNKKDTFESNDWIMPYVDYKTKKFLCTTRIDDDDMINKDANLIFKKILYARRSKINEKSCYHLSNGIYIHIEKDNRLFPFKCNNKSLAVFMSLITPIENEKNIYYYSHDKIANYPEIMQIQVLSKSIQLFAVTNHHWENDTRNVRFKKFKEEEKSCQKIIANFNVKNDCNYFL